MPTAEGGHPTVCVNAGLEIPDVEGVEGVKDACWSDDMFGGFRAEPPGRLGVGASGSLEHSILCDFAPLRKNLLPKWLPDGQGKDVEDGKDADGRGRPSYGLCERRFGDTRRRRC